MYFWANSAKDRWAVFAFFSDMRVTRCVANMLEMPSPYSASTHALISCCWAAAAIVANSGTATLPLALPAGPWNLGRSFVAQAITFDAQGAFQNLLTLSNGLRVTLGRR